VTENHLKAVIADNDLSDGAMKNVEDRLKTLQQKRIFESGVITIVNQYFDDMQESERASQEVQKAARRR
jgi:hypothetical protein